jgi:FlaA1/EpsC-like NDP-sugar epimerase
MNLIGTKLNSLQRRQKTILVLFNDLLLSFVCWIVFGPPMATLISSDLSGDLWSIIDSQKYSFIFPAGIFLVYFYFFGYYKSLIRYFDSRDSIFVCVSGSLAFGFSWAGMYILQYETIPTGFLAILLLQALLLSSVLYAFINISRDVAKYFLYPRETDKDAKPVIIFGSGKSAAELLNAFQNDSSKNVVGIFDDSVKLKNTQINNIPIISSFKRLVKLKLEHENLQVFLAMPNITTEARRKIISDLETIKVSVRTVPSMSELISDQKRMTDIQALSIDDILPGARITAASVANAASSSFFISGAGGSIGSEITRQILLNNPKIIILFEMSEFNLFKIERECSVIKSSENLSTQVIPILGDIRDAENLKHIFSRYSIDTVYHAAAYKHVPLVEDEHNIAKAAENNIFGTFNLAQAAIQNNVSSFVMISTDKAVRPTNVMGATKRFSEIIIQSLNDVNHSIKFSMVRFGNVINSSGSVIPLFMDQIALGGPVTITDKEVMRYFMTIPEASNLVLQAGELSSGGEVFILDMGEQIKIYDLAKKLIHLSGRNYANTDSQEGIKIVEIGLRPGEKMYEELLISGLEIKTENEKIFKANETFVHYDALLPVILEMQACILKHNNNGILNILAEHVEGFER